MVVVEEHHKLVEVVELLVPHRVVGVLRNRAVVRDTLVVEVAHHTQAAHSLVDRSLVGVHQLVEGNQAVELRIPAVEEVHHILVAEVPRKAEVTGHTLQVVVELQGLRDLEGDTLLVQMLRMVEEVQEDSLQELLVVEEGILAAVEGTLAVEVLHNPAVEVLHNPAVEVLHNQAVEELHNQAVEVPHNPDNHREVGVEP